MTLTRAQEDAEDPDRSLRAYGTLLYRHPGWSLLWLGEVRLVAVYVHAGPDTLHFATLPRRSLGTVMSCATSNFVLALQIASNLGNWFSYVSTLLVVDKLGGGKGVLLSIVLIMRFLPSIFLFPIAGIFADR